MVLVVTHPEATHHVEKVVGGWHDSELTPAGLEDAAAIGRAVGGMIPADVPVEIFTSDLKRARQTAEIVAGHVTSEMTLDPRLREKSYGVAEGRPQAWLDARFVPSPAAGDRMGHHEGIEGAETKRAFGERIYAAMDDILARPSQYQIISTHGFALTFVVAAWLMLPIDSLGYMNLRAPSGSITRLEEDDFFHNRAVVSLASTAHLRSSQK